MQFVQNGGIEQPSAAQVAVPGSGLCETQVEKEKKCSLFQLSCRVSWFSFRAWLYRFVCSSLVIFMCVSFSR
jgi:hypothetical protein